MRHEPGFIAEELRKIDERRPISFWSEEERRLFAELFGNDRPDQGKTMRIGIERSFPTGYDQRTELAKILLGGILPCTQRAKNAYLHGKTLLFWTEAAMQSAVNRFQMN
jgi:hypothetical protein